VALVGDADGIDMQHHLWFIALHDQLHLAPINPNPQNVLDMGTGTGIWAIGFGRTIQVKKLEYLLKLFFVAMRYPSAQVIGSDLSPIQPELYVFFSTKNCMNANKPAFLQTVTSKSRMWKMNGPTPKN
jgi:SAM-dependent methyltransferase